MLQPKDESCIILFGIPNYVVEYAAGAFTKDILRECVVSLDPSFSQSPPVTITLNEQYTTLSGKGKGFSVCLCCAMKFLC